MNRNIADRNILDNFCIEFCKVIEKHCKYIIVSGFVAISSGRTRGTEDIDIIIESIDNKSFKKIHYDLIKNGFTCMQSESDETIYEDYLTQNTSVRYTKQNNPLPEMELKLARDDLDNYQIKTRTKLKLTGLDIWFSNINVNIAFKEEELKSDKDLEDAEHLRIVYSEIINETEIDSVKNMIKRLRR